MSRADDPALTAVRGLAAFWVFVYHAWLSVGPQRLLLPLGTASVDLTPLASAGWAGVGVFYVLSGFLLWGVFADWAMGRRDSPPLGRFAERRALRILPPYYAQVALLAVLGLVTTWVERPTLTTLAFNLTLTHGLSYEHFQAVNNVWWTLSIEAQFYVALPLLAWAVKRFGWSPVLAGGLAMMLAWRIAAFAAFRDAPVIERVWILEQLPGRIDQFLLGMFASHLARAPTGPAARLRDALRARTYARLALVLVAPVGLIGLAYLLHVDDFFLRYWAGHPWIYAWHLVAGLAVTVSLYALAIRPDARTAPARHWALRAAVAFGVTSYSFYLWHELILRWFSVGVKAVLGEATLSAFAVNFALGLPLCLAVAIFWYWAFERPFLGLRGRLRTAPTASATRA
jgi:peptidoglycan/LPS O-acetylase OafA/YrhL